MSEAQTRGMVPEWDEGDRLAKALKVAHVKVGEMADYLGVTRNTIGNYTSGRVAIDKRTRMLWAMRTNVSIEWLEHGRQSDPQPTPPPANDQGGQLAKLTDAKRARARGRQITERYVPPARELAA